MGDLPRNRVTPQLKVQPQADTTIQPHHEMSGRSIVALRLLMLMSVLFAFLLGWLPGVITSLSVLLVGAPPSHQPVWSTGWGSLPEDTALAVATLMLCATGFLFYSVFRRNNFAQTVRDIGLALSTPIDWRLLFIGFSCWYFFHFLGAFVGSLVQGFLPSFHVTTSTVPQDDVLPFFLNVIQAGPTEEIALVPLFLLLITAAFPVRFQRLGLWVAVVLAVCARVSFHLYYGPVAFVQHSVWALGVIATWFIVRNVWGTLLAHSCSNGIIALSIAPGYSFLAQVQVLIFLCALVLLALNRKLLWERVKDLRENGVFSPLVKE